MRVLLHQGAQFFIKLFLRNATGIKLPAQFEIFILSVTIFIRSHRFAPCADLRAIKIVAVHNKAKREKRKSSVSLRANPIRANQNTKRAFAR
ncbi:MAG: hypothetical protein B6D41_02720 [Chloroflexi bacterium UTCFX4]|nr:MAG: hypothetical protein B6D41_02720 [Chloroflexi bacterium UTCFX4]